MQTAIDETRACRNRNRFSCPYKRWKDWKLKEGSVKLCGNEIKVLIHAENVWFLGVVRSHSFHRGMS